MARLIESSLWVDFTRKKTPAFLKQFIHPLLLDPDACLCEPVAFEVPHRGHLDILKSFAFPNLVHPQRLPITSFDTLHAAWERILPPERHAIKQQVEAQGISLKDWGIAIYRGVLTGFNDAFYLTQEQRDTFVADDPRCADFLVPLLRGRHVSRYATDWDGTWMIATFPVLNLKFEDLPSPIRYHLQQFKKQLQPKPSNWSGGKWNGRKAGAYEWFETQDVIG